MSSRNSSAEMEEKTKKKKKKEDKTSTKKKKKKSSEKKKAKEAELRARDRLLQEKASESGLDGGVEAVVAAASSGAEVSMRQSKNQREASQSRKEKEIAQQLEQMTLTKEDEQKLAQIKAEELAAMDEEEMRKRQSRMQKLHNVLRNVQRSGHKVSTFDRDEEEKKWLERRLKKLRKKEESSALKLYKPVPVMEEILNAGCVSYKHLVQTLRNENVQQALAETDIRALKASLEAAFHGNTISPLNYRVEKLYRYASVIHEFPYGNREINLKLAIYAYNLLLEVCDPQKHQFYYASLSHALELAEEELDKLQGYREMNRGNKDFEFEAPEAFSGEFNFQRKGPGAAKNAQAMAAAALAGPGGLKSTA